MKDYRWVTAVNAGQNLLLGYIWPATDFPWLNLWLRLKDGAPFARGLEFGTTGLHKTWPEVLEMEHIFGKNLYEEIGVNDTIIKTYYTFLSHVPSDYEGVESVTMNGDKLRIEHYGLDPTKSIELFIRDSLPSAGALAQKEISNVHLDQNFPNPFTGKTTIAYAIQKDDRVALHVYNSTGQLVCTLVDTDQDAGSHQVNFNASGLPAGIYMYRLSVGVSSLQKIMIIN
jgi:hypothetical protein